MRKFRSAAAVAALVAALGTAGAGTAVAGGPAVEFEQENGAVCKQSVKQASNSLIGDINLGLGIGVLGEGEGEAVSDRSVEVECEIAQGNEVD